MAKVNDRIDDVSCNAAIEMLQVKSNAALATWTSIKVGFVRNLLVGSGRSKRRGFPNLPLVTNAAKV